MREENDMPTDDTPGEGLFPIRTVSSLTGVNPITLRAWERRYGLVRPQRTGKGHRLYTQADVDLINRVVELLEEGIPISRVRALIEHPGATQATSVEHGDAWHDYQQRMITALTRFDEAALDSAYNDALSLYPVDVVTARLIVPLLKALGERWRAREKPGAVAEEHFFGAYLRNKLGARFHHLSLQSHGPKLVAACLPDEHHEIGLLLFCLSAASHGFRPILLGADLPLDEVSFAAHRSGCVAVVLSGSLEAQPALLSRALPALVADVDVPVFVGGQTAVRHRDAIVRAGATPLGIDVGPAIRLLEETLGPTTSTTD
jgi:DNA-binding transcriptional MerR regulator